MPDLNDLIAQRDTLNRQIKEQAQAAAWAFGDSLEALMEVVYSYAQDNHVPWTSSRKNVTTVTLAERVSVDFGREEEDYRGFLAVRNTDGLRADFGDTLPPVKALIGLIGGLLGDTAAQISSKEQAK
jgi:hypothetical protein